MPPPDGASGLLWVSLPYATFGLGVIDGMVVETAPIARRALGWSWLQAVTYYERRGRVEWLPDGLPETSDSR